MCFITIHLLFIFITYVILYILACDIYSRFSISTAGNSITITVGEEVIHKETVCGWHPSFSTNFNRILRSEGHHHRCLSDSSLCDDERRKVCIF